MARRTSSHPAAPAECPVCGEAVPRNAQACSECGADHNSGWSPDADAANLDLPDDDFRYNEWLEEEFGKSSKPARIKALWWLVAIILFSAFVLFYLLAALK